MQRFFPLASVDESDSDTEDAGATASHRAKPRRKAHQRPQGSDQIRQAFSKRKKGLVLKSYQLFRLTDAKVFMFVVNDKGSSWAYATPGFGAPLGLGLLRQLRDMAGVGEMAGQSKCYTEVMQHPAIADHDHSVDDRDNYVTPRGGPAAPVAATAAARSALTDAAACAVAPARCGSAAGGAVAAACARPCSSFSNASAEVEYSGVAGGGGAVAAAAAAAAGPCSDSGRARGGSSGGGVATRALSGTSKPRGGGAAKGDEGDDAMRARPPSGLSANTLASSGAQLFASLPVPVPVRLPLVCSGTGDGVAAMTAAQVQAGGASAFLGFTQQQGSPFSDPASCGTAAGTAALNAVAAVKQLQQQHHHHHHQPQQHPQQQQLEHQHQAAASAQHAQGGGAHYQAPYCDAGGYGGFFDLMDAPCGVTMQQQLAMPPHGLEQEQQQQQHHHHHEKPQHRGQGAGPDSFVSLQARLAPLRTRAPPGWPVDGGTLQVQSAPAGGGGGGAVGTLPHMDTVSDYGPAGQGGYAYQTLPHQQAHQFGHGCTFGPIVTAQRPGSAAPPPRFGVGALAAAAAAAARLADSGSEPSPTASIGHAVAALAVNSAPCTPAHASAPVGAQPQQQHGQEQQQRHAVFFSPGASVAAATAAAEPAGAPGDDGGLGSPDAGFLDDPILAGLWASEPQPQVTPRAPAPALPPPLLHYSSQPQAFGGVHAAGTMAPSMLDYQLQQVAAQLQATQQQQQQQQQQQAHGLQHAVQQQHHPQQQQQQQQQPQQSPHGAPASVPALPPPALAGGTVPCPAARERILDALSAHISTMSAEMRAQLQQQLEASSPHCPAAHDPPADCAAAGSGGGGGGAATAAAAGRSPLGAPATNMLHGPSRLSTTSPAIAVGQEPYQAALQHPLPQYVAPAAPPPMPCSPIVAAGPVADCSSPLKRGPASRPAVCGASYGPGDDEDGSPVKRPRASATVGPLAFVQPCGTAYAAAAAHCGAGAAGGAVGLGAPWGPQDGCAAGGHAASGPAGANAAAGAMHGVLDSEDALAHLGETDWRPPHGE